MNVVGIRELKDRLSEVVRIVRRKGPVLVSHRGEVVAELRSTYGGKVDLDPGLAALAEKGWLRPGEPPADDTCPRLLPVLAKGTVRELLDEGRGEW